jgi:hypothetical protein
MKLAQRQQGEISGGKWGVRGRARQAPHVGEPPGSMQADAVSAAAREREHEREDDPYRGKSDGEILQRCEL